MNFKKWVKSIQTAGYNGTHAVNSEATTFVKKNEINFDQSNPN